MAAQAFGPRVAARTCPRHRPRNCRVRFREIGPVTGRPAAGHDGATPPPRPGLSQRGHGPGHRFPVAGAAALPRVAARAAAALGHGPMPENEIGQPMRGRRPQGRRDRKRSRVRPQCLDGRHLRSIHVARRAELPRMARCAGGRRSGGLRSTGRTTMTTRPEGTVAVRQRSRKAPDIGGGKANGAGQRHVTSGAGRVGRLEVGRDNTVAAEAARHRREANLHPRLATLDVTRGASRDRVGERGPARCRLPPMGRVIEPQVGARELGWRLPVGATLDGPIVAAGAHGRRGPRTRAVPENAGVASLAGRKQVRMP